MNKPRIQDDLYTFVNQEKLDELVSIQQKLLDEAYLMLKDGGTLVYSTCSINKKENDRQPYNILGKDEGGRPYFGRLEIVVHIRALGHQIGLRRSNHRRNLLAIQPLNGAFPDDLQHLLLQQLPPESREAEEGGPPAHPLLSARIAQALYEQLVPTPPQQHSHNDGGV